MDTNQMIRDALIQARDESVSKRTHQLTLGKLIDKLNSIPDKNKSVRYDFGHFIPGEFGSWRGSYEELYLSYEGTNDGDVNASDLLNLAIKTMGTTFEGYKGGDFVMTSQTPIWISSYGTSGHTMLTDVIDTDYWVILKTEYGEY